MIANSSNIVVDPRDVLKKEVKASFFSYVQYFWDVIIAEDPVWNWHIPYLCAELEKAVRRLFKGKKKKYDLIINIPQGTTKSTLISVMLNN